MEEKSDKTLIYVSIIIVLIAIAYFIVPSFTGNITMTGQTVSGNCENNGTEYPIGSRLIIDNKPMFCDLDTEFKEQVDDDFSCNNDYECINEECAYGTCINQYLEFDVIPTCDEGTYYGLCSDTKPEFCYGGEIIDKCSLCGCPNDLVCNDEGTSCVEEDDDTDDSDDDTGGGSGKDNFNFYLKTCKTSSCTITTNEFNIGDTVYIDYHSSESKIDINTTITYPSGNNEELGELPTSIGVTSIGLYKLVALAEKSDHYDQEDIEYFAVIEEGKTCADTDGDWYDLPNCKDTCGAEEECEFVETLSTGNTCYECVEQNKEDPNNWGLWLFILLILIILIVILIVAMILIKKKKNGQAGAVNPNSQTTPKTGPGTSGTAKTLTKSQQPSMNKKVPVRIR